MRPEELIVFDVDEAERIRRAHGARRREAIRRALIAHRDEWESILRTYTDMPGASLDEGTAAIDEGNVTVDDAGDLSCYVRWSESWHLGCRDLSGDHELGATFDLVLDLESGQLRMIGYEPPERDADDI